MGSPVLLDGALMGRAIDWGLHCCSGLLTPLRMCVCMCVRTHTRVRGHVPWWPPPPSPQPPPCPGGGGGAWQPRPPAPVLCCRHGFRPTVTCWAGVPATALSSTGQPPSRWPSAVLFLLSGGRDVGKTSLLSLFRGTQVSSNLEGAHFQG